MSLVGGVVRGLSTRSLQILRQGVAFRPQTSINDPATAGVSRYPGFGEDTGEITRFVAIFE
ncbi:MAG: hypothetical protein GX837_02720 [Methanomicrobiales archaeon]|nr:hypothetical protein [Methanomicrobiales archaeon]